MQPCAGAARRAGEMHLKNDGTFESTYDDGKKVETFSGTYTVTGSAGAEVVALTITHFNGSPAPSTPPSRPWCSSTTTPSAAS